MFRSSNLAKTPRKGWILLIMTSLSLLLLAAAGCSDDPATPSGQQPQAEVAASLAQPARTVASVEENLDQIDLFASPLSTIAGDAGLSGDADLEGWTGDGISFPDQSAQLAQAVRDGNGLPRDAARLSRSKALSRDLALAIDTGLEKADGDTISVEYFDTADSTGLNALVMVTEPDLVKYVVQRQYPAQLGHPVRIEQEIVIDTNGTLENDSDDSYHSASHLVEMTGGELATGTLAPVSGSGPMQAGVLVLAHLRVENPRWRPLQEWNEVDIVLDPGDFRTEGDESLESVTSTVHWLTDAEYTASIAAIGGGSIDQAEQVRAVGHLNAAPANHWLASVSDTLVAYLGDLETEEDDLLISLARGSVFDGTASDGGSPRHHVRFLPDEPVSPGDEPCGGEAHEDVWYPSNWLLVHLQRDADLECDGSGTLHELREFRNGSSFERTVSWDGQGGATVSESRLDGTTVSGSFDEGTGQYDITTTFPVGHDPVARHQSGTALESSIEAYDVFTWQDAHADSTYFNAVDDVDSRTVSGYHRDGDLREQFTVTATGAEGEEDSITGSWSRNDGATGEFTLEQLEGGSSHLAFSASDPAAEGSPSVVGEITYAPDGSGTGTVTITQFGNTVTYEITFGPDGEGSLEGDGGEVIAL